MVSMSRSILGRARRGQLDERAFGSMAGKQCWRGLHGCCKQRIWVKPTGICPTQRTVGWQGAEDIALDLVRGALCIEETVIGG